MCVPFFVFFIKQKTAYEIGTGDWSSDVCSSDLDILKVGLDHISNAVGILKYLAG